MAAFIPIRGAALAQALGQGERQAEIWRDYRIDWEEGVLDGFVDGADALRQRIRNMLLTPRFKCSIHDIAYGSELQYIFSMQDAPWEYKLDEAERTVRETLSQDPEVRGVDGFEAEEDGESVRIRFQAETVYGAQDVTEVYGVV